MMRTCDLAQSMLDEIKLISPADVSLLVRIDSQKALKELKMKLAKLAYTETEASCISFEPVLMFLAERWDDLMATKANITVSPHSAISQACLIVAKKLSVLLKEPHYQLLIPSTISIKDEAIKDQLATLSLHQFIIADDGFTPIHIAKCLDTAFTNKTEELFHTTDSQKKLSGNEKERVIYHSREAFEYYDVIQYIAKNQVTMELEPWQKKIFHETFSKNTYRVTWDVKAEGNESLATYILRGVHTFDQLTELMEKSLSREEWKAFIKLIPTKILNQLVVGNNLLSATLAQKSIYKPNHIHNRKVFMCLSEVYLRKRRELGEHTSTLGHYAHVGTVFLGNYTTKLIENYGNVKLTVCTKAEKEDAVDIFQDFIMSNEELTVAGLMRFLKAKGKTEFADVLLDSHLMINSELALLVKQMDFVCQESFFQEKKPGLMGYFW